MISSLYEHRISNHAAARYRERVRDVPAEIAKAEILACLQGAKAKHLRKLVNGSKNTVMVPTGCCTFICSLGNVVTVVNRLRTQESEQWLSLKG